MLSNEARWEETMSVPKRLGSLLLVLAAGTGSAIAEDRGTVTIHVEDVTCTVRP